MSLNRELVDLPHLLRFTRRSEARFLGLWTSSALLEACASQI